MSRIIVITSGKGGVGKTTISANLGLHLAKRNQRVCVIDMDIGLNNLDVVLGVEDRILYTMQDVIEKKCRLRQALIQDDQYPLLFSLSSGNVVKDINISTYQIKQIIDELSLNFDFILIDCPAGIDAGFNRSVSCANEALVITTPHLSAIRDADKVVTILSSYNLNNKRFVVNRARGDLIKEKMMLDVYEISKALGIEFGGLIPEDDHISNCLNIGTIRLNDKYSSVRAFDVLAENILTGSKKLFDCTYKYKGLLGNVRRLLKKRI
ncbi:MAG: septum site-determining protein MinD [Clostridia bacterium]|nr:septum site-determining protein MinD [Clostridia bacterium]